jgi:hypothetical protein
LCESLTAEGIAHIRTRSRSVLSKYYGASKKNPIYVVTASGRHVPLEDYTPLFQRYSSPALTDRVYIDPEQRARARTLLHDLEARVDSEAQPTVPEGEA